MATYKALADCVVFDVYRRAGEQFTGPEWRDAHAWPMPKHLARIDPPAAPAQENVAQGNVPTPPENPPAAPAQEKRGRGGRTRKA